MILRFIMIFILDLNIFIRLQCKFQETKLLLHTMIIWIRSFAMIREAIGTKKINLSLADGSTIWEAIEQLIELYPRIGDLILEENKLSKKYILLLNDKELANIDITKKELFDSDVLTIIPPAGGG